MRWLLWSGRPLHMPPPPEPEGLREVARCKGEQGHFEAVPAVQNDPGDDQGGCHRQKRNHRAGNGTRAVTMDQKPLPVRLQERQQWQGDGQPERRGSEAGELGREPDGVLKPHVREWCDCNGPKNC